MGMRETTTETWMEVFQRGIHRFRRKSWYLMTYGSRFFLFHLCNKSNEKLLLESERRDLASMRFQNYGKIVHLKSDCVADMRIMNDHEQNTQQNGWIRRSRIANATSWRKRDRQEKIRLPFLRVCRRMSTGKLSRAKKTVELDFTPSRVGCACCNFRPEHFLLSFI